MTIEEALNLMDQVFSAYRGSRQEHVSLQVAEKTIRDYIADEEKSVAESIIKEDTEE